MSLAVKTSPSSPFAELLGIKQLRSDGEGAQVELELRDELLNGLGIGHGGVVLTLLDVVMGRAVRSADLQTKNSDIIRPAVTAKLETHFLRPALPGILHAYAQVIESNDEQATVKGWVVDSKGKKIAQGTAVFKYLRASRTLGL